MHLDTAATLWNTMYLGIDLAADPKHTGMAVLREIDGGLVVESTAVGVSDAQIIDAVHEADGTGVDVPIGWPIRFAELLQDHAAQRLQPPESTDAAWRRGLALRTTDMAVHRRTGITPLSVSANLIAYPAFRWVVSRRSSVTKESIPVGMAAELWLRCILQRRYIVGACHIEAIRAPKTRPSASTWWSCLRPCFLLSTGKDSKL